MRACRSGFLNTCNNAHDDAHYDGRESSSGNKEESEKHK